jgi:hypothetical protein
VNQAFAPSPAARDRPTGRTPLRCAERWKCFLGTGAVAILLLLFPCTGTAAGLDELWLAVFPGVETGAPKTWDPRLARFLQVASDNLHLFELMPVRHSPIREVVVLPDKRYPSSNPAYFYVEAILLVGPLVECEPEPEQGFASVNLHDYAHGIFAASFYRGLGLDPSAYEGRYDPRAAFAEKDVSRGELDKVVPYGELARPFEEVFADAFAAFALADPKAVATALRDCGHFNLRDFDEPYDASSWDEGDLKPFVIRLPAPNPYQSRSSTEGPSFYVVTPNVQEVLSPLRSAVWRAYTRLKSRGVTRPGAIVLKAIHCAAVIVARDQHDSGIRYRSWFAISRAKYNELAIMRFEECMASAESVSRSEEVDLAVSRAVGARPGQAVER